MLGTQGKASSLQPGQLLIRAIEGDLLVMLGARSCRGALPLWLRAGSEILHRRHAGSSHRWRSRLVIDGTAK